MNFTTQIAAAALVAALVLAGCTVGPGPNAPEVVAQGEDVQLPPAPLDFPPPGTEIAYYWIDTGWSPERPDIVSRGIVTSGPFGERQMIEERYDYERQKLFPGCLLHCSSYPITEDSYLELLPLEVGKEAEFIRERPDGSAAWRHRISVTGTERVRTRMGGYDVFVLETDFEGIEGHRSTGRTVSYWSPELATTVYEVNTGGGDWRAEHILVDYELP